MSMRLLRKNKACCQYGMYNTSESDSTLSKPFIPSSPQHHHHHGDIAGNDDAHRPPARSAHRPPARSADGVGG